MYEVKEAFKPKEGAQAKSGPEKARSFAGLSKASVQLAGFSLTLSLTESGHEGPSAVTPFKKAYWALASFPA